MTYTVKYRQHGKWFWKTIKKVKGDLLASDLPGSPRVFILEDETRVEVPALEGLELIFSKERFFVIKKNMEKESGTAIPVTS